MLLLRQPADTQALHYFEQILLQPGYWDMAKGSSIPVTDSEVAGGCGMLLHILHRLNRSCWCRGSDSSVLSKSNEKKYLNSCNKGKLSLLYPEKNSTPCDLREVNCQGLQISKWQLHWTQGQLSSLISTEPGSIFCDHFSLAFGLTVCGLS